MPKTLNFVIIGCGRIASRHAEQIRHYGKLLAVCDPDKENASRLATAQGCPSYPSLDELLERGNTPDIMVICSPNGLHASHCLTALERGCHVLCEKPFALNAADCDKVILAAEKQQLVLQIVQSYRYNPAVILVREALLAGRLGAVRGFQLNCLWNRDDQYYRGSKWKGSRDLDGGILFTQFSHFIDLLPWFFGDAKRIMGFTCNTQHHQSIQFEDMGAALLEFKGGVSGSLFYTINSFLRNLEGSLTLLGDRGTVRIGGEYCNELVYQQIEGLPLKVPGTAPVAPYPPSNHHLIYRDFMQAVAAKEPDYRNARESLQTVALTERIYRASGRKWKIY
ncbi:MAG TPA: Gfo/Idh/MocA family oxidoreductase [Chitinophagaceae bacterium]|nr:Gfo/Idh/MocA family oxidoreductase [Chitinophagaceae bacterium]